MQERPFDVCKMGKGTIRWFITEFSALIAFLVSLCAIAITTGALINYLIPAIPATGATVVFFSFFVLINLFGIGNNSNRCCNVRFNYLCNSRCATL